MLPRWTHAAGKRRCSCRINADPVLLPGIRLGVNILDTCSRSATALIQCALGEGWYNKILQTDRSTYMKDGIWADKML
jgi:hypothetical protein